MDVRLDSTFESWGNFAPTITDTPSIPGRLFYDPVTGVGLQLVGSVAPGGLQALLEMPSLPRLYGRLVNGTLVTLANCIITRTQLGAGGIGLPTEIVADRLLLGSHVDDVDQLNIKSYTVELSSLTNWTCASPGGLKIIPTTERDCGIDYRHPDPIHIGLADRPFDLSITHRWNASDSPSSCGISWHAGVTIVANDEMQLAAVSEIAWQCQQLMSLLIGHPLSVKSIAITPVNTPSAGTKHSPLELIFQQHGRHDHRDLNVTEMLLSYAMIKEAFPTIVAEWFARSEQALLATDVLFGSALHESPALEMKFLTMTQAAESYHRSLGTGVYMAKGEYEAAIAGFLSQIPEAIQGDHRVSLKSRLKWGYEYSFFKRLTDLLKRLPADVQSRIAGQGKASEFLAKVKDTRNYFTHLDHTSEQNALKGKDAFVACERLRILVVANLLHDLGITDKDLLSVLERNREFKHWMDQELLG